MACSADMSLGTGIFPTHFIVGERAEVGGPATFAHSARSGLNGTLYRASLPANGIPVLIIVISLSIYIYDL